VDHQECSLQNLILGILVNQEVMRNFASNAGRMIAVLMVDLMVVLMVLLVVLMALIIALKVAPTFHFQSKSCEELVPRFRELFQRGDRAQYRRHQFQGDRPG
jgi:hypothetical protein